MHVFKHFFNSEQKETDCLLPAPRELIKVSVRANVNHVLRIPLLQLLPAINGPDDCR